MKTTKTKVYTQIINTPLGEMGAYATDKGLFVLKFSDKGKGEKILQQVLKVLNATLLNEENSIIVQTRRELTEYFNGDRQTFQIPLYIVGTDFQKQVWQTIQNIPYGKTISYGEEAKQMKQASAVRAIANANGRNRISIIIPCHRIIGSDGSLTGYGGGLDRKKWLLEFEKKQVNCPKDSLF